MPHFCTPTAASGQRIEFDRMGRQPYLYICGVGPGPKSQLKDQNFHFPLMYVEGAVAEATTYNGYLFRAENARRVPVPELPEGWQGKSREHVRCKNFQFAVAVFGYPPVRARLDRASSCGRLGRQAEIADNWVHGGRSDAAPYPHHP